jgi:hypothetical protein
MHQNGIDIAMGSNKSDGAISFILLKQKPAAAPLAVTPNMTY